MKISLTALLGNRLLLLRSQQALKYSSFIPRANLIKRGLSESRFYSSQKKGTIPFLLADIGEGITEVQIIQWFVKEGDRIQQFDKIAEVQSDKAAVEITSRYDGVIKKLHYKVNDTAKVGQPLIDIESAAGSVGESEVKETTTTTKEQSKVKEHVSPSKREEESNSSVSSSSSESNIEILTTPSVRRIAREEGVDLKRVKGTGKDGRIMKHDILNFLSAKPETEGSNSSSATSVKAPVATSPASNRVVPLSPIQKAMVKTMTQSLLIPHFGYKDEIRMDYLIPVRNRLNRHLKELSEEDESATASAAPLKLSYMPFFIKAASLALTKFPILNSSLDLANQSIVLKGSHNIGVAMDTPSGLIVPNIKGVEKLSIIDIARELVRLQGKAAKGQLSMAELQGGTFSLSNIGTIGGTYTSPVIVSPEVCIGALGAIQRVPKFEDNDETEDDKLTLVDAKIVYISWSADHRVIDGATMARFSNLFKSYIEEPELFLLGQL